MKHLDKAVALLPLFLASGCATTQSTSDAQRESFEVVQRGMPFADIPRSNPNVYGKKLPPPAYASGADRIPADRLPAVPRIIADDQTIELSGFGLTREERAMFAKARSQRINWKVEQRVNSDLNGFKNDGKVWLTCFAVLPLCPVVLPISYATVWAGGQTTGRIAASIQEPSLIPERDGSRLAVAFNERATGALLRERTLRLAEPASRPAESSDEFPRLVIRIKAVQLSYWRSDAAISITAQAQAFVSPSSEWSPTEHVYHSLFRPLAKWTTDNAELVHREIDDALDALASNIWATYSPKKLQTPEDIPNGKRDHPVIETVRASAHE